MKALHILAGTPTQDFYEIFTFVSIRFSRLGSLDIIAVTTVASFLVLQSLPLLREILHDRSPLEISIGGVAANGVVPIRQAWWR
jgi:hypothetical protein